MGLWGVSGWGPRNPFVGRIVKSARKIGQPLSSTEGIQQGQYVDSCNLKIFATVDTEALC